MVLSYKSCKVYGMTKNNIPNKMHTIAIDDENYRTLKALGTVGESFNDVVTRLINIARRRVENRQDDRS
jgi:ABC-type thiamine transport system substrate-binding protein